MKKIWTSLKSKKNLWIFLGIILLFGMGVGIYFGLKSIDFLSNTIANYTINQSLTHFSIYHFIILSVLLISSFLLIGIPLSIAYLFYEGMSIGFCLTLFISSFHLKGCLYMIVFILITKLVFLIIYGIFFSKILNIGKSLISWLIYKNNKKDLIVHLTVGCILLILIIFCYDLLVDFLGIKLIHTLSFLLN